MNLKKPESIRQPPANHESSTNPPPRCKEDRPVKRAHAGTNESRTLKLELARRRATVKRMETTRVEATVAACAMGQLLSDRDFIAVLADAGFKTVPRFLCKSLLEKPT
jgi:hypothetical protein